MFRILCSIDMDDDWAARPNLTEGETFLPEAYENIFNIFQEIESVATLFIIGKDIERTKDFLFVAKQSGFELGNHSFTHRYNKSLSAEEKVEEILRGDNELRKFGPVFGYRAPGWGVDRDVQKILVRLGYKYDASLAIGGLFPLMRLVHWAYSGNRTHIYGTLRENLGRNTSVEVNKSGISIVPLISPYGIPFYNSIHYLLPAKISNSIIARQISGLKRRDFRSVSFIFHARDFVGGNFRKSADMLRLLASEAEVSPISSLFF